MNRNNGVKPSHRSDRLAYLVEALWMGKKLHVAKSESVYVNDDSETFDRNLTLRTNNTSNKCETIKKKEQPQIERIRLPETHEDRWEKRFSELQDFKKERGHCKVPGTYINRPLARWVLHQRSLFKRIEKGEKTILTIEKRERFEKIGFELDSRTKSDSLRWDEQFSELQNYKKEWGHCNVPTSSAKNKSLSRWVVYQRDLFRLAEKGEKSSLTTEKRKRLESIGFQFVFSREKSRSLRWNKHFSTLQDFKEEWGHCNVPTRHAKYNILSVWVKKQRHLFECLKRGDKICFDVERRRKLESIGFQWNLKNLKPRPLHHSLQRWILPAPVQLPSMPPPSDPPGYPVLKPPQGLAHAGGHHPPLQPEK